MLNPVLIYLGAAIVSFWGIAHLFPTRSVVSGFGDISIDNKRIIFITSTVLIILGGLLL
jgi:hypothetical protein